jgi:hypothetical protein
VTAVVLVKLWVAQAELALLLDHQHFMLVVEAVAVLAPQTIT